jgi:hypothetical protein
MKIYGLILGNSNTVSGKWTKRFALEREDKPTLSPAINMPEAYSGRDFFTFDGTRWIDVYRSTVMTKQTLAEFFQDGEICAVAHGMGWEGMTEPTLVLLGDSREAFDALNMDGIMTMTEFRQFVDAFYPEVVIERDGDKFRALSNSTATIYWEVTGGSLDTYRTKAGEWVTISGAAPGAEVRAGWKFYSNAASLKV